MFELGTSEISQQLSPRPLVSCKMTNLEASASHEASRVRWLRGRLSDQIYDQGQCGFRFKLGLRGRIQGFGVLD